MNLALRSVSKHNRCHSKIIGSTPTDLEVKVLAIIPCVAKTVTYCGSLFDMPLKERHNKILIGGSCNRINQTRDVILVSNHIVEIGVFVAIKGVCTALEDSLTITQLPVFGNGGCCSSPRDDHAYSIDRNAACGRLALL